MMFDVKTIAEASEIVTLSDVKGHLYITHSDDDSYLTSLITVARKQIEAYCVIAIGEQEKQWIIDACGNIEIKIPYQPVISVDTVENKIDYSTYNTLTEGDDFDTDGGLHKTFTPFISGRFKITYTTGYTTLPEDLKQGILVQVAYLYENRSEGKEGICEEAKRIVQPYRDLSWM